MSGASIDHGLDTSKAPSSIEMYVHGVPIPYPDEPPHKTALTIAAAAESNVNFKWNSYAFEMPFGGGPHKFMFLLNGDATVITTQRDATTSGSFSQHLNKGDIFGFDMCCSDHYASGFRVSISDFNVTAVPEPFTYAMFMMGLGLVSFMVARRKNQSAETWVGLTVRLS